MQCRLQSFVPFPHRSLSLRSPNPASQDSIIRETVMCVHSNSDSVLPPLSYCSIPINGIVPSGLSMVPVSKWLAQSFVWPNRSNCHFEILLAIPNGVDDKTFIAACMHKHVRCIYSATDVCRVPTTDGFSNIAACCWRNPFTFVHATNFPHFVQTNVAFTADGCCCVPLVISITFPA